MIENQLIIKLKDTIVMEIAKNKITEIFCITLIPQHFDLTLFIST